MNLVDITTSDYADDVRLFVRQCHQPPVLIGWSMGGLVCMMVAAAEGVGACFALSPSLPARGIDPSIQLRSGEVGPEEYGITSRDVADQPAMPDLDPEERRIALGSLGTESRRARDERQLGVVINSLCSPLLIVTGTLNTQWPATRYENLWFKADRLPVDGASHWGLVLNRRGLASTVTAVCDWLDEHVA